MNCLRCGREIPEKQTFCEECWKTVNQPLKQSPYLNTQIILPTRRKSVKAAPVKSGAKNEKKSEKAERRTNSALTMFLGALCILVLVFSLVISLFYLELRNERIETLSMAAELEKENQLFSSRMDYISKSMVFVDPNGERFYHRMDCPLVEVEGCEIIRLRTAQMRGYQPCPECH